MLAAASDDYFLIHYEIGGEAHGFFVVMFLRRNDTPEFIWGGALRHKAGSLDELRKCLQSREYRDDAPFTW